jgi:uncharacterized membrane protein YbhN (UPF0104 family)
MGLSKNVEGFHQTMAEVYAHPGRLAASAALHLTGWLASAGGGWLALYLLGQPISLPAILALESLMYAARTAAFVVPGALGVQEGAYALLGPVLGVPAETALALSLLKRARDLAMGAVTLIVWQVIEGRRALARPSEDQAGTGA